jgi:putative sigma-54 modulation protein
MKIEFVGRNVVVDDAMRELAQERLAPILRFLREPIDVHVELEAGAGAKRRCAADVHVRHHLGLLTARAEGVEIRDALIEATAGIEAQARRVRKRTVDRRRRAGHAEAARRHWPVDVLSRESLRGGERPRILRSSKLEIEPLTLEEAAVKLEGSRNEFVVFVDRDNDRVSVLYKRRDEDYGLIAPEW